MTTLTTTRPDGTTETTEHPHTLAALYAARTQNLIGLTTTGTTPRTTPNPSGHWYANLFLTLDRELHDDETLLDIAGHLTAYHASVAGRAGSRDASITLSIDANNAHDAIQALLGAWDASLTELPSTITDVELGDETARNQNEGL